MSIRARCSSTSWRLEGYPVETAANGKLALERLAGGVKPAVILLDLMMPVMDGWQFRQRPGARFEPRAHSGDRRFSGRTRARRRRLTPTTICRSQSISMSCSPA